MTPLKILIVDDTNTNIFLLERMLTEFGHKVVTAANGLEAIKAFLQEAPDLILMDVMMPNMDGIEASRHIREISPIIPIVFLSAATDEALIKEGLEIGSDYITKPIELAQLTQKLNAHFRTVLAYQEVVAKNKEIQSLHDKLLEENQVAARVLSRMLSRMHPPDGTVQYPVIPSGIFSGDIVLAGTTPSGRLNIFLADAIGHGLSAAFSLMPIIPVFEAMTKKGFPLEDILFEMNRATRNVMPAGRFIAGTAVSVDFSSGRCEVWVGGNPLVSIIAKGKLWSVPSSNPSLGIVDSEDKTSFVCEVVELASEDRIVFWSAGFSEAWDTAIMDSCGDLSAYLCSIEPSGMFEKLMSLIHTHTRHDDTSLVVINMVPRSDVASQEHISDVKVAQKSFSRIELELDVEQLKMKDLPHTIIDMATKFGLVNAEGIFAFVFTELFANALDHGVLGIWSEVKYAESGGLDKYMQLREEKLAQLEQGHIRVEIEATSFNDVPATLLRIVDSGPGFDYGTLVTDGEYTHEAKAGRGFKLVMNMCLKVSYAGIGNDVTVYLAAH